MRLFGAGTLMTVSLVEVTFYIGALEGPVPELGLAAAITLIVRALRERSPWWVPFKMP